MKFLGPLIVAYLALGVQLGLGDYVAVRGGLPNVALLAALFIGLSWPRDTALLGCFALGVMQDLTTTAPLGLYALAYSLAGWLFVSARDTANREHPLAHVLLAIMGGGVVSVVILLHGLVRGPRIPLSPLVTGTVYTALLAPVVLFILQRLAALAGGNSRRRYGY